MFGWNFNLFNIMIDKLLVLEGCIVSEIFVKYLNLLYSIRRVYIEVEVDERIRWVLLNKVRVVE